jgi:hypothetical protein
MEKKLAIPAEYVSVSMKYGVGRSLTQFYTAYKVLPLLLRTSAYRWRYRNRRLKKKVLLQNCDHGNVSSCVSGRCFAERSQVT